MDSAYRVFGPLYVYLFKNISKFFDKVLRFTF